MRSILFIISLLLTLVSCSKEESEQNIITEPVKEGNIDLSNPQYGQKSYYLSYWYNCNETSPKVYTGDTLVLEYSKNNLGEDVLKEYYTSGSTHQIDSIEYPANFVSSELLIIDDRIRSRLFNFYANDSLFLSPNWEHKVQQHECSINLEDSPFEGNAIAWIPMFSIHDIHLELKTVVSCDPIIELEGFLIYDNKQLVMSHRYWRESWFTNPDSILSQTVEGFYLINE